MTANMILKAIDSDSKKTSQKTKFDLLPIKTVTSQDEMPFDWIKNGVIRTSDGRYVSIIEVLPINFNKKSPIAQKDIATSFGNLFSDSPDKLQIKIANDIVNTNVLVENILNKTKDITEPTAKESIMEYIKFIYSYASTKTIGTRYFIIYEYEGSSTKFEDIAHEMYDRRMGMISILADSGNQCIKAKGKELDHHLADILYYFFNRASSFTESRAQRSHRINTDIKRYNEKVGKKKAYTHRIEDDVAPKGLYFNHRNHVYMDGYFYSWLGVKGNSYPSEVVLPWMNFFTQGTSNDIDIYFNRVPKHVAQYGLKAYKKFKESEVSIYNDKRKYDKARQHAADYKNAEAISIGLENENDLYNFGIILTVRGASPRLLGDSVRTIKKNLSNKGPKVDFEDSNVCCEDYFLMTLPLLYYTKPWKRIRHNIITSQIASFYPFTNYQFFDPNGAVIGLNKKTQSLVSVDVFNTGIFDNPHMFVSGATGSGKTTFMQSYLERLFFNGANIYAIIPKKGYQYKPLADLVGGKFYDITKVCINIMSILPEKKIDTSQVSEDDVKVNTGSLLAKKTKALMTFINMLVDDGVMTKDLRNKVDIAIKTLYAGFGITDDNKSIYLNLNTRELKSMPTLQDLYEVFNANPELRPLTIYLEPFVFGKFSNFNGQTNIDTTARFIAFDVNEDQIDTEYFPAVLSVVTDFCYSIIKDPNSRKSIIDIDECWAILKDKNSCAQIDDMVRLIRGYGGAVIMASQFLKDANKLGNMGTDIIDNCELKLLLKTPNLSGIKGMLRLTDNECELISKYRRGRGMLVTSNDKIDLEIKLSQYELNVLADKTSRDN